MKNKHRRLFGQNNRITKLLRYLSAKILKGLLEDSIISNIDRISYRKTLKLALLTLAATLFFVDFAQAQNQQSDTVNLQISNFVTGQLISHYKGAELSDINFSLNNSEAVFRDKHCSEPISVAWRHGLSIGQTTLKVECHSENWKAFVPIKIQLFRSIVITAAPLDRNTTLEASDLTFQRADISRLYMGYFENIHHLNGYQLKRTLKAGQVLTPYVVKAPPLVRRGDWVTITSGNSVITVTSAGEAMKDGLLGDQIRIRNRSSNQIIKAWVTGKGLVSTKKGT